MSFPQPTPLGLKKSFGFGDRLGLATPGHLASLKGSGFAPIFAQQSIREMERTDRTPEEVMQAAATALEKAGFKEPWGADADHLKTEADVKRTADAGFCFFTIDPSEHVENAADTMSMADLESRISDMVADGVLEGPEWQDRYLGAPFEIGSNLTLRFERENLLRAAVKYGRAIHHAEKMARSIEEITGGKPFEIEVSVDETDSPTSPLEHLFFGAELQRRKVKVVSLAPRFIGEFEKGIDYRGDLGAFENALEQHVAVARHCGPYKISVHSGSDKFSVYPILGRVCDDLLHVKTAGTSYLEALRVVVRVDQALFTEIADYSRERFAEDRRTYHISTSNEEVASLVWGEDLEEVLLNQRVGRQLLHVTFGSVLTKGKRSDGQSFKDALLQVLHQHPDLHVEVLEKHLGKHLQLLNQG